MERIRLDSPGRDETLLYENNTVSYYYGSIKGGALGTYKESIRLVYLTPRNSHQ